MPGYIPQLSGLPAREARDIQLLFEYFYQLNDQVQALPKPFTSEEIRSLTAVSRQVRIPAQSDAQLTPSGAFVDAGSLSFESVAGSGVILEDSHANRLANFPSANYPTGALFFENDRTVFYRNVDTAGVKSWKYASGIHSAAFASRPTDLGTDDVGFLLWVSIYNHIMKWGGAAWNFIDTQGGYFGDFAIAPPTSAGWILCDGTATTYLTISGADLAETAFTPVDENSGAAGVYHKSIAAYTGTINAAVAPGISGSTAATTATNNAAATGITIDNEAAHTHAVTSPTGGPSATVAVQSGAGTTVATDTHSHTVTSPTGAGSAHSHGVTDPTHNHTQNAHTHGIGTIVVDATAQPRNLGVLRYFRR